MSCRDIAIEPFGLACVAHRLTQAKDASDHFSRSFGSLFRVSWIYGRRPLSSPKTWPRRTISPRSTGAGVPKRTDHPPCLLVGRRSELAQGLDPGGEAGRLEVGRIERPDPALGVDREDFGVVLDFLGVLGVAFGLDAPG